MSLPTHIALCPAEPEEFYYPLNDLEIERWAAGEPVTCPMRECQADEPMSVYVLTEPAVKLAATPTRILWDHYAEMRARSPKAIRNIRLTDDTRRMIERALKDGSVEEWMEAIDSLLRSPHHIGKNDRGRIYLEPRHVFTKCTHATVREHLDWLLDLSQNAGGQVAITGEDARILQAKKAVLQAYYLAGSSEAQRLGDESERFLLERGIRTEHPSGAAPTFAG